jgi:predicted nucleic acid-binding protein
MGEKKVKCYVDSNVLLSYFKRELGGITKAQMIRAEQFLRDCAEKNHEIVLSDLAFFEIRKNAYLDQNEVTEILGRIGVFFTTVRTSKKDLRKAGVIKEKTGIHHPDSLHTQLAIKSRAKVIVTWNIQDFEKVRDLIAVCTPSSFT